MNNRSFPVKTRIVFLSALLGAAFVCLSIAQAATITVTNTNESGAGSLRQALAIANDGDTIDFSVTRPATITLTSGELLVNKSVTINGPPAIDLTVRSNSVGRVFHVTGGVTATIARLVITDVSRPGIDGGGIYNQRSMLTVSNCFIHHNRAVMGGGIYNDGSGSGGNATLNVLNSTLSDNRAGSGGGAGIYNNGSGGGNATLSVLNSTLRDNIANAFPSATAHGAGIYNDGSSGRTTLTVLNSTISNNSVIGQRGSGGGIYNRGTLNVRNSTFSGNFARSGGGIYNVGGGALSGTIFNANPIYTLSGTLVSRGYNLSSDDGGRVLYRDGDRINTNPLIGPLQANGGPTLTHALLPGSPAINAGNPNFTPPPNYDQRGPGFGRVVNGRIDIGSFEVQATPTATPTPTPEPRPTPTPRALPTPTPRP